MSFRLAMAVVGATTAGIGGIAAKSGAFEEYGIDPALFDPGQFQALSDFSGPQWGGWGTEQPASVVGSKGAKFVAVDPKESDAATEQTSQETLLRDKILEMVGIHSGPDPREGHSLDALKMRQKDDMGALGIKDIGMDAMMNDIAKQIRAQEF